MPGVTGVHIARPLKKPTIKTKKAPAVNAANGLGGRSVKYTTGKKPVRRKK